MATQAAKHSPLLTALMLVVVVSVAAASIPRLVAEELDFISDPSAGICMQVGRCTNAEATTPPSLTPRDAPKEYSSCPE